MATNATCEVLARNLAMSKRGSFTGLIITLKGKKKGSGVDRKLYGDDHVHVVIVTGFNYSRLVERSMAILGVVSDASIVAEAAAKVVGKDPVTGADIVGLKDAKTGLPVTIRDVIDARTELTRSLAESIARINESTTSHVYEPLVVDGEVVIGCRVYKCVAGDPLHECHCADCNPTNSDAPKPGTIYLQGLQIGKKVLIPAANGPIPPAASSATTIAKDLLRKRLPIRRYVSYPLDGDFLKRQALKSGVSAAVRADADGVVVDEGLLAEAEVA